MTGTLEIPFAIGETVWAMEAFERLVCVDCPDCLGSKCVTLVLANGDKHSLDCARCTYDFAPRGALTERTWEHLPVEFTCRRVEVNDRGVSYSESGPEATCWRSIRAERLFRDRAACEAACLAEDRKSAEEREQEAVRRLASKHKELARSVHYWRRKVSDLEKDLARARGELSRAKANK